VGSLAHKIRREMSFEVFKPKVLRRCQQEPNEKGQSSHVLALSMYNPINNDSFAR